MAAFKIFDEINRPETSEKLLKVLQNPIKAVRWNSILEKLHSKIL